MDETPSNNLYDDKLMAYIYDDVDDSDIFAFKPSFQDSDGTKNVQDNSVLNTALPSTNSDSSSIIAENEELKLKIKQLESEKSLLELRISEVYQTAKAELERKDKRLLQLNDEINNMVFKRKHVTSQSYRQPNDKIKNNVFHQTQPKDNRRENQNDIKKKFEDSEPSTCHDRNVQVESNDILFISDDDIAFVQTVHELKTDVSDKSETTKTESKPELRRSPRKSAGAPKPIKNEVKSSVKQLYKEKNLRDSNNLRFKSNKKINEDCFIKNDNVFMQENAQNIHIEDVKSHLKFKGQKISSSVNNSEQDKNRRSSERIKNIDKSKSKSLNPHRDHGESSTKLESLSKSSECENLISNTSNFASNKDVKSKENITGSRRYRTERGRNGPQTPPDSPPSSFSRNKTNKRTNRRSPSNSPSRHHRTFRSISPLRTRRDGKSRNDQSKREEGRFELRSRSRGEINFRTNDRDRRRSPSLSRFPKSMGDTKRLEKTLNQRDRYGTIIATTYGEWKKLNKSQKEIEANKDENKESRKRDKTSLRRGEIDYGDINNLRMELCDVSDEHSCDDVENRRDVPNRTERDTKSIQSFKGINKLFKPELKKISTDKQEGLEAIDSSSTSDNSVAADTAFSDFESYMSDIESNFNVKSKPSNLNKKKESDLNECKTIFEFRQRKVANQDTIITKQLVAGKCVTEITGNIAKPSVEQMIDQKVSKNFNPKEEVKQSVDEIKPVEDKTMKKLDFDRYKQRCSARNITKSIKASDEMKKEGSEKELLNQKGDETQNDNFLEINKIQESTVVNDKLNTILNGNGKTQNDNFDGGNNCQNITVPCDESNKFSNNCKLENDNSEGVHGDKKNTVVNDEINKITSNNSETHNNDSELLSKNQKAKVVKDEVNTILNNSKAQDDYSEIVENNQNNPVLVNDNSFLHDLSMSEDEDEKIFENMEPIKDDKVKMQISILDVVVIPANSSTSSIRNPDRKKNTVSNAFEAAIESHSRKNSGNFECIEQIQEAIHTNVPRTEHSTSMASLSELDTEELQKCLEDDSIPEPSILPEISPDNIIDSKLLKRSLPEKNIHLFGSDSSVNFESIAKFDEMQAKKMGKNVTDLPTVRKIDTTQETKKMGVSKPKMRKSRYHTADEALPEILSKSNLGASMEGGSRSFNQEDMNYSIIRNNMHYIPVFSSPTTRVKLEQEAATKKEQFVDKCADTTTPETKNKRKRINKQPKAKIKVKMPFNEQNKKDKRIEKCKSKRTKCSIDSEKTTPSKSRPKFSKKKQQIKVKEIPQINTDTNSEDITHKYGQVINEEMQTLACKKHQEQKGISKFEAPLVSSVKVKRKNKNNTKTEEHSPKEEQKPDIVEQKKTQTRRITPVKIGEVNTSIAGNLMEEGTKKRKINTIFKDERPGKVQKTSVEFGISSQSPLPHIEGMLKLFERKSSTTHVYTDCYLGSTKTTSFQRKLSDLGETNAVDASNDNTVNQINLDSKDVSLLGTLERVILDNMTEYLGDKSLHSFGSEDKTRGIKTTHNEPQNGNEYIDKLDFSNMLEKNLNTSTPLKSLKKNNEVDVPQGSTNPQGKQIDSDNTSIATNDFSIQTNGYKSYLATPMKRDRRKRVRVIQLIQKT